MLVEVEERKLVPRHDVRVGGGLNLGPDLIERVLKNVAYRGVGGAIWGLSGDFERLGYHRVDAGRLGGDRGS